jgi:predicted porin
MTFLRNTVLTLGGIAAAAAAVAAPSTSSVTLSGMFDIGVYRGFDGSKQVGPFSRSNITLSGQEDLGGGLAATFKLQHRFESDTGSTEATGKPFWQGESTVGLKGGFGHVRLGRALDVVSNNDWTYDPWYNFDRIASPAWNNWHWNYATDRTSNSGGAEYGRLSNGIFYDSPAMGGFTLHFSGSFEDSANGGGTGNNSGLSLNYAGGGISAMLASSRNSSGDTVQFLGLNYSVGNWAVMGAYDRSVFDAAVDSTAKVYTLGLTYAMGATTLKAGYGNRDVDGAGSNFLGLGASHSLSKRTSVYVSLGRQDPDAGDTDTAYGVGMSHSF